MSQGTTGVAQTRRLLRLIDHAINQDDVALALNLALSNFAQFEDTALLRERIATALVLRGRARVAAKIYALVARHYANSGFPTRALATLKQMGLVQPDISVELDYLSSLYHVRSTHLNDAVTRREIETPQGNLDMQGALGSIEEDQLIEEAQSQALSPEGIHTTPGSLPPIPFLSMLPLDILRRTIDVVDYEMFVEGQDILTPEEYATDLVWSVSPDLLLRDGARNMRIPENSLLGLNGFGRPRMPTQYKVHAPKGAHILRLSAKSIRQLNTAVPDFANRVATLRRHALTERLLSTHSLFVKLTEDDRLAIAGRFVGMHIPVGERVLAQAKPSTGLYILLDGQADVIRKDDAWEITIATLRAGDMFGEIGLVSDAAATADVHTTSACTALYLSRQAFNQAAAEFPMLAQYAANLASKRIAAQNQELSANDLAEIED